MVPGASAAEPPRHELWHANVVEGECCFVRAAARHADRAPALFGRDNKPTTDFTLLARHEALGEWPEGVPPMPNELAAWCL